MALFPVIPPRVRFARPPLTVVICQVQFEAVLAIGQADYVAGFQERVRSTYPRLSRVAGVEVTVGPEGIATKPASSTSWLFESADAKWTVALDANSLSLTAKAYAGYDDFRDRLTMLLPHLVASINPGERTRLGLRYVNQLHFDDVREISGWRTLVRPELLGIAASGDLGADDKVMHNIGQIRFADEGSQLFVRHGYVPGGTVGPDVAPLDRPYFLLDLDNFDVRRFPSVDVEGILEQVDSLHDSIYTIFRWCLTRECEARMGVNDSASRGGLAS